MELLIGFPSKINLNLIYSVLFIYTGILTSIIAYTNLFYNSPATNKFFVIRYGYVFILYIIIETIILYLQGSSLFIPVSILTLTIVSLYFLPDILVKIKLPKLITYLLLFWSWFIFLLLLELITKESGIFAKINSDEAGLYTGALSIILVIIPMILHAFYPERVDD
jgi:hypothetical protein